MQSLPAPATGPWPPAATPAASAGLRAGMAAARHADGVSAAKSCTAVPARQQRSGPACAPLSASAGSLTTPLSAVPGSLMGASPRSSNTKHSRCEVMVRLPGNGICGVCVWVGGWVGGWGHGHPRGPGHGLGRGCTRSGRPPPTHTHRSPPHPQAASGLHFSASPAAAARRSCWWPCTAATGGRQTTPAPSHPPQAQPPLPPLPRPPRAACGTHGEAEASLRFRVALSASGGRKHRTAPAPGRQGPTWRWRAPSRCRPSRGRACRTSC